MIDIGDQIEIRAVCLQAVGAHAYKFSVEVINQTFTTEVDENTTFQPGDTVTIKATYLGEHEEGYLFSPDPPFKSSFVIKSSKSGDAADQAVINFLDSHKVS